MCLLATIVGRLENGDVKLAHLQHRVHHLLSASPVRGAQHSAKHGRNDLPRQVVAVLQQAALPGLTTASQKPFPEVIDLGLGADTHKQRDRFSEPGVHGPTIEQHDLLAAQSDRGGEDRAAVTGGLDVAYRRAGKHRGVKLDRGGEIGVEPKKRGDGGHWDSPARRSPDPNGQTPNRRDQFLLLDIETFIGLREPSECSASGGRGR